MDTPTPSPLFAFGAEEGSLAFTISWRRWRCNWGSFPIYYYFFFGLFFLGYEDFGGLRRIDLASSVCGEQMGLADFRLQMGNFPLHQFLLNLPGITEEGLVSVAARVERKRGHPSEVGGVVLSLARALFGWRGSRFECQGGACVPPQGKLRRR